MTSVPEVIDYNQQKASLFQEFNKTIRTPWQIKEPINQINESLYFCHICSVEDNAEKIRCDKCKLWYHFTCVNISIEEVRSLSIWLCFNCATRVSETLTGKVEIQDNQPIIVEMSANTFKGNLSRFSKLPPLDQVFEDQQSIGKNLELSKLPPYMDQVFESQLTSSKSDESQSVTLTHSRRAAHRKANEENRSRKLKSTKSSVSCRAALALLKLEEERRLSEERDKAARERDKNYLDTKYAILEADGLSELSYDDEELPQFKDDSVKCWSENVPMVIPTTTSKGDSQKQLFQNCWEAILNQNQPAATSLKASSQPCQWTQSIVGDYTHLVASNTTTVNSQQNDGINKPPSTMSSSHWRNFPWSDDIQLKRQTFYQGESATKDFNTPVTTAIDIGVSSCTRDALATESYNLSHLNSLNIQSRSQVAQGSTVAHTTSSYLASNELAIPMHITPNAPGDSVAGHNYQQKSGPHQLVHTVNKPNNCGSTFEPNSQSQPVHNQLFDTSQASGTSEPIYTSQLSACSTFVTSHPAYTSQPFSINSTCGTNQPVNIGQTFSACPAASISQPYVLNTSTFSYQQHAPIQMNQSINGNNQSNANGSPIVRGGLTSEQIAARHVMPKDLPQFSGDPLDWLKFISAYENSNEACSFTNNENLGRLQKCLTGVAETSVKSRLLHKDSVPGVIDTLRLLFGRPELIIEKMIHDIQNLPSPKDDDLPSLIKFAIAVQNLSTTIQILRASEHLRNPLLINSITDKLPAHYQLNWAFQKRSIGNVHIGHLGDWLYQLADMASQVLRTIGRTSHNTFLLTQAENVSLLQESEVSEKSSSQSSTEGDASSCEHFSETESRNQSLVGSDDDVSYYHTSLGSRDSSPDGSDDESSNEEINDFHSGRDEFETTGSDSEISDYDVKPRNNMYEVKLDLTGSVNGGKNVVNAP